MSTDSTRTLIVNATVSIDGFSAGPGGDMSWLSAHAAHERMSTYFEGVWRGVDTALLGRVNYEGFHGYWPSVAEDESAPARDRDLARWMNSVAKVVFSRTLTEATWRNARIAGQDPVTEVRELKRAPGRDIIVLSSASLIRTLLAADLVDELRLQVIPELLGDGLRLFDGGLPASSWTTTGTATLSTGAIGLHYVRAR
ncbi:deaminase [Amycolatopsis antarctica]|uniref:Deaminase n=1 Tax=Amycolatopsis antarctica TaxID=1854586 RepID=A0A263D5T1_9PSEU|nr:dihydrofolate reductase family protein [Amycolatopsis antarctica]OZM72755.1 deaminase [Amycolatopsis antarctica]